MNEENKMTTKDKWVLGVTLAIIFGGVFILGLVGMLVNLLSKIKKIYSKIMVHDLRRETIMDANL